MTSTEEKPDVVLREFVDDNDGLTKKDVSAQALAKGQGTSGYEKLTIWQTIRAFKMNCLVCFLMTLSAATDGYQLGSVNNLPAYHTLLALSLKKPHHSMLGGIIANPGFVAQFATKTNDAGERILAAPILSAWSAIGSIGQIIGMTTLPFLSDRFGRKAAMYYYWFLLAVSIALECAAREWRLWLVAKLFGGLGVGCMQSTIPTYIAEVAPTRVRGVLLMCYSLWWITGQFFAPVALQVMSETRPEDYLTPIYTQWSQVGLMLLIYLVVPESPAWLASRGREELGKKTLEKLNRGVPSYDAEHQYYLLNIMIEHERAVAAETRQEKWYAIFKGQNGFRTTISCWTLMSQQFVGLSLLAGYQTYFFQQAGVQDPFAVTCITSGINIAFTLLIMYLADAWGRRWIACSGITLCWGSCVLIGILGVVPTNAVINKLLVLFAVLWSELSVLAFLDLRS